MWHLKTILNNSRFFSIYQILLQVKPTIQRTFQMSAWVYQFQVDLFFFNPEYSGKSAKLKHLNFGEKIVIWFSCANTETRKKIIFWLWMLRKATSGAFGKCQKSKWIFVARKPISLPINSLRLTASHFFMKKRLQFNDN